MTTVNKKEIEKFSKMAEEWWDVEGKFKPLHKFNPIRIKYIKESVIENFKLQNNEKLPFDGINLLDIGCGGDYYPNQCVDWEQQLQALMLLQKI